MALPSGVLILAAWILGGLLSMAGSLALAEVAVAYPETGGLYVFIREGFGRRLAFVFGWANLVVIKPTVIASIATVFAIYVSQALGLSAGAQLPAALLAILTLTFVNWLGVREGTNTQTILTTAKVVGILALCVAAFALPHAAPAAAGVPGGPTPPPLPGFLIVIAFTVAMIPIFFAYDGWTDSTYVAGEIVHPRRNLPIAILGGTAIVIAIYVLTNVAYLSVLSPREIATYEAVASEAIRRVLGTWGGRALAVLVAVSTFGTISSSVLTGPRVTLAMAADGLFWSRAGHVDPRRGSPDVALWLQGILSCVWLALASRGFEDVSGWFVTTSWLFYGLAISSLFVLRKKERMASARISDGYRTPLYPLTPWVFILVTVAIIGSDLATSKWRAAAGVLMAALGFPIYSVWKGRAAQPAAR